jgi:glycosyltransferase involved in cell wall biosynthesis
MNFPDGNAEEFLMSELPYLAERYDNIRIYPIYKGLKSNQRKLPNNVKVINHNYTYENGFKWMSFLQIIYTLGVIFYKDARFYGFIKTIKNVKSWLIYSNKILVMHHFLKTDLNNIINPVFYSYWSLDWLSVFALKDFGRNKELLARMLGIDVYEERHHNGFIPWRRFSLEGAKLLLPNSEKSLEFVKFNHKGLKLERSYLGIQDINEDNIEKGEIVLLSSSRLIRIKRVDFIADLISQLSNKIVWKHWGNEGSEKAQILTRVNELLPKDRFQFFNHQKDVKELYKFYNSNPSAIFIHLSTTEGLPTSLIEAACMGLPIICTDAGGSNEVVENGVNGFVVPVEFDISELALMLDNLIEDENLRRKFGMASRRIWEAKFSAKSVYPSFHKKHLLSY